MLTISFFFYIIPSACYCGIHHYHQKCKNNVETNNVTIYLLFLLKKTHTQKSYYFCIQSKAAQKGG